MASFKIEPILYSDDEFSFCRSVSDSTPAILIAVCLFFFPSQLPFRRRSKRADDYSVSEITYGRQSALPYSLLIIMLTFCVFSLQASLLHVCVLFILHACVLFILHVCVLFILHVCVFSLYYMCVFSLYYMCMFSFSQFILHVCVLFILHTTCVCVCVAL